MGRGDYDIPPPSQASDEFGVLSRALASSAEKLSRLDALRREFVANAAHELRTPVTAIRGYAETLQDSRLDEATRAEFVQVIHRNALRISRLVDDLLQLHTLEVGEAGTTPMQAVALAHVTEGVLGTVGAIAEKSGAEILVDVPAGLQVRADPDRLEQVLQNLIENALKHGGPGVRVQVSARQRTGTVFIEVADNGPGIPPEAQPQVFDRFYRVDKGRARKEGGSGLGLAIVKQLCESMGGKVAVSSSAQGGATFAVELEAA
jgi:two-component system phosphate regulon sensor histidine kinase PhoR